MRNFLTIPWQQNIIEKTEQKIVLRGARGGGKTEIAIHWAIESMKKGKEVAYITGISNQYAIIKSMIIAELRRQRIHITGGFMGNIHTPYGKIEVITARSHYFQGHTMQHDAIVIDDADHLLKEFFLNLRWVGRETPVFVTGTYDRHTMNLFLIPSIVNNKKVYHEVNWKDMLAAKLIKKEKVQELKMTLTEEVFHNRFGPWVLEGNKHYKNVLERYDS